ncbi:MAG: HAD family hydrolase [Elainellaceae cyanobacterium]
MQTLSSTILKGIKLVATDMDGTLTQAGKFTPALLQSLSDLASAGIPVLIVTGRSAGWVNGLVSYLPITGAIAENGGLFYSQDGVSEEWLVPIANLLEHRQQLAAMFHRLQTEFPHIQESSDNRFRLTDWTFDVQGLRLEELEQMRDRCHKQGWGFTYSTVQCHIKLKQQEKAIGLSEVMQRYFPQYQLSQIITVGDSPNDESLFDSQLFPRSVGVANIRHYADRLTHQPAYVTLAAEAEGFMELAQWLLS